jgi:hypothetical protein
MRPTIIASLLVSGGRVVAESRQPQYGAEDRSSLTAESVLEARQAFREIHNRLLSEEDFPWDSRLGVLGYNASGYEAQEWNTDLDEVIDDQESGSLIKHAASGSKSRSKHSAPLFTRCLGLC